MEPVPSAPRSDDVPGVPDAPDGPDAPPAETGPIAGFHAVVPAGGAGTRLWPLSRASAPKFLLDLTGSGATMLQATVDRLTPLTGPDGVLVVTGEQHGPAVRSQLPGLDATAVLTEPSPRDSMAAIGLAAAVLAERVGDVVLGSFAADHVITGPGFAQAVREAVEAARTGEVVTIGIRATAPSSAFGYIRMGEGLGHAGAPAVRRCLGFTEKPDPATAAEYLATGEYRWNAGMFVVRTDVLLDHLAALHPQLHAGLRTIAAAWDGPDRAEVLARVWPGLTRIAIDHAIAEPVAAAGGVAVVPGDFEWDDVGDFDALARLLPSAGGSDDVHVLGDPDRVLATGSAGAFVSSSGDRLVAVLGLPDVVVVQTADALLVTTRDRAQDVKQVVDRLRAAGRTDLL